VLTVSDLESFETRGGMIALVRKDRRIHPRINIDTVEKSKLKISAKLLNLATVIRDATAGN
jgi:predicted DNA binding CopG/RHH family protein